MYQTFTENKHGFDYAVGDIHGCYTRLYKMLDDVGFDPKVDRLFSVGDLVDRGPESHLALDFLEHDWVHAVSGNHDWMAVEYALQSGTFKENEQYEKEYLAAGGEWNIYGSYDMSQRISWTFSQLPIAIEYNSENHGRIVLVHADLPEGGWDATKAILDGQKYTPEYNRMVQEMMWDRDRVYGLRTEMHPDISYAVVGHTTLPEPCVLENVIYIDTGACFDDGYFTLLRLHDLEFLKEKRNG